MSGVGVPLIVDGNLWGVIAAASSSASPLPLYTEERLAGFVELIATAVANAEARNQLTESRARVVASTDETRRRIERDLHDGAQQQFLSIALEVEAMRGSVPPEHSKLAEDLEQVSKGLSQALDELREFHAGSIRRSS